MEKKWPLEKFLASQRSQSRVAPGVGWEQRVEAIERWQRERRAGGCWHLPRQPIVHHPRP